MIFLGYIPLLEKINDLTGRLSCLPSVFKVIEEKTINKQKVKMTQVEFSATWKWVRYSGIQGPKLASLIKVTICHQIVSIQLYFLKHVNTKKSFKSFIYFTVKKALRQCHVEIEIRNLEVNVNPDSSCPLAILEQISSSGLSPFLPHGIIMKIHWDNNSKVLSVAIQII